MMRRVLDRLIPYAIAAVYHVLARTIRWELIGSEHMPRADRPAIYVFWHARLLMMPYARGSGWRGYMLISEHRDGGLIADTVHLLGVRTVRGSSTRGGARALRAMIRSAREQGASLGITPDGPRGPAEKVKPGVVALAKRTGLPVIPVCYATRRHWRARSWDRFYIPWPFTRGVIVYGEPVRIDGHDRLAEALERVQKAMDRVRRRADDHVSA